MKHTIIIALAVIIFAGCKKKSCNPQGSVTFYQMTYSDENLILYIDGQALDHLFNANKLDSNYIPPCGANVWPRVITKDLLYGRHSYFVKSPDNQSDTFYIEVNSPCQVVKVGK